MPRYAMTDPKTKNSAYFYNMLQFEFPEWLFEIFQPIIALQTSVAQFYTKFFHNSFGPWSFLCLGVTVSLALRPWNSDSRRKILDFAAPNCRLLELRRPLVKKSFLLRLKARSDLHNSLLKRQ